MKKQKEVLAAGILKDYRFRSKVTFDAYVEDLKANRTDHRIIEQCPQGDGTVLARVLVSYNASPLIQLFD